MKIFLESSVAIPTVWHLPQYGGLERVVADLAVALAKLGHEVTVAGARGSMLPPPIEVIETVEAGPAASEEQAYGMYKDRLLKGEFEIVHSNSWLHWAYMVKLERPELKVISTHHQMPNFSHPAPVPFMNLCGCSSAHAVEMSAALGIPVKWVSNPVDPEAYPFSAERGERYLSLNRMQAAKGVHNFVDIIRRTRKRGDVVGEDRFLIPDLTYPQRIRALCDGYHVRYWGSVSHEQKLRFLQACRAVVALPLYPYREIFGLSVIEGNMCGAPSIVLNNCALPEIVKDGVTGFVCKSLNEVEEVVKAEKAVEIDPAACKEWAEKNFNPEKIAGDYFSLYREVLEGKEW